MSRGVKYKLGLAISTLLFLAGSSVAVSFYAFDGMTDDFSLLCEFQPDSSIYGTAHKYFLPPSYTCTWAAGNTPTTHYIYSPYVALAGLAGIGMMLVASGKSKKQPHAETVDS